MAAGMATSSCSNSGVIRIVCETLLGIASSTTSYQFTEDLSLQNKISKYITLIIAMNLLIVVDIH